MARRHTWTVFGRRAHLTLCANCRMVRLSKSPASMKRANRACASSWAE